MGLFPMEALAAHFMGLQERFVSWYRSYGSGRDPLLCEVAPLAGFVRFLLEHHGDGTMAMLGICDCVPSHDNGWLRV